jgi:hypothetical protein
MEDTKIPCPECGYTLDMFEDVTGVGYQCRMVDCLSVFDASEIEEDE